jgi:SAM-dependent methyltransferase
MFSKYSEVYDLLYADKNTELEVKYLVDILKTNDLRSANLLEFGSGTGRHARELIKYGYRVHGVELSAEMAERAEETDAFTYEVGDVLDVNVGRKFDGVISMFHVASYQCGDEQIRKFFRSAARHLERGGKFIFDYWFSPAVLYNRPEVRCKTACSNNFRVWRVAEPETLYDQNVVNVNYTIFIQDLHTGIIEKFTETHPMRHFSIPELEMISKSEGFNLKSSFEYLSTQRPSSNSWGVISVFVKE